MLTVLITLVVEQAWAAAPELPRVFLNTTLVPPTGTTITVASGGDFQAALNAAQLGDVITLQAGATFTGSFTLPNKSGTGWITVRTSAPDSSLPAPGTRISPSYAAVMPKIVVGENVGGAIRTAAGAHHYRFIGIEVKPTAGALVWSLIELGLGTETSEAALPHDIIIDRCYIHGNPGDASGRGVAFNGKALSVIDSYLADFKHQTFDTQAIMGWNGPGPFKIVNNYLEAAGENVIFGGADPSITNLVPADIEVRHNYFFKPTSWRGVWADVKNLFELKNARRVLVEGNVLENTWKAAQDGYAILLTVRDQDGSAPWSTIEDVVIQKNIIRHAGSALDVLTADDPNVSQNMKRVLIRDNVFDDISAVRWGGWGRFITYLGYAGASIDVTIEHNTAFYEEDILFADGIAHTNFIYRNNITPRPAGGFGFLGSGTAEGVPTLNVYFPLAVFQRNVLPGANPAIYPANNFFPSSLDAVGFVDRLRGNYRLAATSPYKNAATDGTDVGANIDAVEAATAGAIAGTAGTADTSAPTVSLTAPANGATVSGTAVTVSANASDNVGVTRVQFRLDGANLGAAVTTPPYSIAWNTTTATTGPHTLSAQAFDAAGNVGTSASVTVTVSNDTTAPTVSIVLPTTGQTVSGTVTITASASDNVGVTRIDYLQDGQVLGVFSPAVLTFSWNTTTVPNGTHTVSARAYDAAGNTTTSAGVSVTVSNVVSTPPPTPTRSPFKGVPFAVPGLIEAEDFDNGGEGVSWHDVRAGNQGGVYRLNTDVDIVAPIGNGNGAVVNNFETGEWMEYTINVAKTGTYRLEINAASEFSTSRWHAEIDGVNVTGSIAVPNTGWWGAFQWVGVGGISLTAGQHILRITADQEYFDLDALRVLAEVAAGDSTRPTVSITAPAAGTTVSGTVSVTANASDNVGVVGVQFTVDGVNLGAEVTTAPYSIAWDTRAVANGSHSLGAVARDAAGNTATATAVTVTVSNQSASGLVAAYSFNEGSGATAHDSSGNGNDGTISGATWTSRAAYGSALAFNGVSAWVTAANVALGGAFTMMAWVYNPTNTAFETIVTVGTNRDLYLGNGVIKFYDGSIDRSFGTAISRKRWHHVAVVSDGSSLRVYLDGAPTGTPQAVSYGAVTGVLQVGAWMRESSNTDFFGGRIDEVRVYNRALTQAEVQDSMNTPIP